MAQIGESFDVVEALRELAREVEALKAEVKTLRSEGQAPTGKKLPAAKPVSETMS